MERIVKLDVWNGHRVGNGTRPRNAATGLRRTLVRHAPSFALPNSKTGWTPSAAERSPRAKIRGKRATPPAGGARIRRRARGSSRAHAPPLQQAGFDRKAIFHKKALRSACGRTAAHREGTTQGVDRDRQPGARSSARHFRGGRGRSLRRGHGRRAHPSPRRGRPDAERPAAPAHLRPVGR
jgi:hypothetical protein